MPEHAVTIIIPTRGLASRAGCIERAVDSVLHQQGVRAIPLVVLNGTQYAPEVESALRQKTGVRLVAQHDADLPAALRAGRDAVDTPFFGTLDDDDELVPDALSRRIALLNGKPAVEVVVSNGWNRLNGSDTLHVHGGLDVAADPLRAFHQQNWLLPGSWLARTTRVGTSLFDGMPRYRECTFLALRFGTDYAMAWLQEPTVIYHVGSPHAISRSYEYFEGQVEAARMLLTLRLPPHMRRRVRREIASALHDAAERCWADGALADAWRFHADTLRARGGLRYLPFTRHLIAAEWRQARGVARKMAE